MSWFLVDFATSHISRMITVFSLDVCWPYMMYLCHLCYNTMFLAPMYVFPLRFAPYNFFPFYFVFHVAFY